MVIIIINIVISDTTPYQNHNNWISLPQSRGIVAGGEGELVHGGPGQRLQLRQEVLQKKQKTQLFKGNVADTDLESL